VLANQATELLVVGERGSGKTTALLALPLLNKHQSAIIFADDHVHIFTLELGSACLYPAGKYSPLKKVWTFAKSDLRVEFGTLATKTDYLLYMSSNFDFVGYDEITRHRHLDYFHMLIRLRSPKVVTAVRVVACTSDPYKRKWVAYRWRAWLDPSYPNPARSGELRWFKQLSRKRDIETEAGDPAAISRSYINFAEPPNA
jgi:energy-coupling factor transporter ATP-binding protein EcfA2